MNATIAKVSSILPGQVAEQLLDLGFSISFEQVDDFEFLSATSVHMREAKCYFLPFDPVACNALHFFNSLKLLQEAGGNCHVVVPAEGERQLILNILRTQEINGVEVWCFGRLKDYPLQVI